MSSKPGAFFASSVAPSLPSASWSHTQPVSAGAGVVVVRQAAPGVPAPPQYLVVAAENTGSMSVAVLARLAPSARVIGMALKFAQVIIESSVLAAVTSLTEET